MKKMCKFLCAMFCLSFCLLNTSCVSPTDEDFDQQEELSRSVSKPIGEVADKARRDEIRETMDGYFILAANKMAQHFSETLTPMSGNSEDSQLDYSQVFENKSEGYYAIRTVLIWRGRDLKKLIDYNFCRVGGWLYYYPASRKVFFMYDNRNSHVVKISSSKDWAKLGKGVTLTL